MSRTQAHFDFSFRCDGTPPVFRCRCTMDGILSVNRLRTRSTHSSLLPTPPPHCPRLISVPSRLMPAPHQLGRRPWAQQERRQDGSSFVRGEHGRRRPAFPWLCDMPPQCPPRTHEATGTWQCEARLRRQQKAPQSPPSPSPPLAHGCCRVDSARIPRGDS